MKPFENIRVADFTTMLAGAGICRQLADLGADVIKIEPVDGDPWRTVWAGFMGVNRGKRCIVIDLRKKDAVPIAHKLISTCQIIVENSRPGIMKKLGLDYETIKQRHPDIIYVSTSAFGRSGPDAERPGYDPLFQALSGQMADQGGDESSPVFNRLPLNDEMVPLLGSFGTALALFHQARTGRGQLVETSLLQAAATLQSGRFVDYKGKKNRFPGRPGIKGPHALNRLYQGIDGKWFYLCCVTEQHWQTLCRVIGREELAGDRRFATPAARKRHDRQLAAILEEVFMTTPGGLWALLMLANGIPAGATQGMEDVLKTDTHCQETGVYIDQQYQRWGKVHIQGVIPVFSETPGAVTRTAPELGEHTREVLEEIGYDHHEIEQLLAKKLVVQA